MTKKNNTRRITLLVVGLAIATLFIVPGGLGNIILAVALGPQNCGIAPNAYNCFCSVGYQKVGFGTWVCEPEPVLPDDVTLPVETWEEAYKFAENQIGEGVECSGEYFMEFMPTGAIVFDGANYGTPLQSGPERMVCGYAVNIECRRVTSVNSEGTPLSGTFAWRVQFDPNDGYVYNRECSPSVVTNCPSNIYFSLNPAFGC